MGILDFGEFGFWILGPESQIQNPKSKIPKIQNPQNPAKKAWILEFGDFGFWGFWILDFWDFGDFGFWIVGILDFGDFGFWGFWILHFGFWGFWILDFRDFGDFGFWIFGTLCSRSFCAKFGFWNLGILDFGDFGFWGSWILDFGLGILDGHLVTKFWMLHKKRSCTRRPGSADLVNICQHENFGQVPTSVVPLHEVLPLI